MAWGAAKKATELGAKVITISGPDGYIYDPAGLDAEKIDYLLELRASGNDICQPYADEFPGSQFFKDKKPWEQKADIYLPCATQNELNGQCRWCGYLRIGDDTELHAHCLDWRGG